MTDDLRAFKGIALAIVISVAIWIAGLSLAFAQDQRPISVQVLQNSVAACSGQVAMQAEQLDKIGKDLIAAQAEVKRLTEKYEPKKDEAEKP